MPPFVSSNWWIEKRYDRLRWRKPLSGKGKEPHLHPLRRKDAAAFEYADERLGEMVGIVIPVVSVKTLTEAQAPEL